MLSASLSSNVGFASAKKIKNENVSLFILNCTLLTIVIVAMLQKKRSGKVDTSHITKYGNITTTMYSASGKLDTSAANCPYLPLIALAYK